MTVQWPLIGKKCERQEEEKAKANLGIGPLGSPLIQKRPEIRIKLLRIELYSVTLNTSKISQAEF